MVRRQAVQKAGRTSDKAVRSLKRTFSLRQSLIKAMDEMVSAGLEASKNALVERALLHEFQEFRRRQRAQRWSAAAKDPNFLKDIGVLEGEFWLADQEALRQIG